MLMYYLDAQTKLQRGHVVLMNDIGSRSYKEILFVQTDHLHRWGQLVIGRSATALSKKYTQYCTPLVRQIYDL